MSKVRPLAKKWNDIASKTLVGRKIVGASYMTQEEVDANGWPCASVVLTLDNGMIIVVMTDDEGNGPGALSCIMTNGVRLVLPVV